MSDVDLALWSEATAARHLAVDTEAEAERARSAYHETIRRLHTSGVSLREIARHLEISHQRVHQIVSETACGFCRRRRADCQRLVAGPGVFVCDRCVSLGLHALAQGWGARVDDLVLDVATDPDVMCCFCRRSGRRIGPMAVRGTMRICGRCLADTATTLEEASQPVRRRRSRREEQHWSRRFTRRVGLTLERAAEEAQNLGHPAVLPEHILLGILGVEDSVGAKLLISVGIDGAAVRADLVGRHPEGNEPVDPPLAMAPNTKRALEQARKEARSLNHNYLGTEHLVLAMARVPGPAELFVRLGVDADQLRAGVGTILGTESR